MTKTAAINALIAAEYKRNGGDIVAAFDAVLGAGSYAKLAADVYHSLRAA
jgi:hypothetical protein